MTSVIHDQPRPEVDAGPSWADGPAQEVLPYGAPQLDWHEVRRTGIGGSDALAALGLSPWSSPYKLWLDKSGRLPPAPATGRMAWGHRLEPLAADWFAELHGKTLGTTGTWRHPVPLYAAEDGRVWWMLCNPDRYVHGERAGVEIKTVDANSPDVPVWLGGVVPDYPQGQAQWCMGVTGADGWYVVAVVDGCSEPIVDYVARDDDLIADMREAAADLCRNHLATDIPPPVDGSAGTEAALGKAALARAADEVEVELGVEGGLLLMRRRELKAQLKAATAELREVENGLKAPLVAAGAEYGLIGGRRRARLPRRSRAGYTVAPCEYVELREVTK